MAGFVIHLAIAKRYADIHNINGEDRKEFFRGTYYYVF